MNARAGIKVDKATFYRFIERQAEGRFEYDRGSIVQQMTGGPFNHAQIVNDFSFVLRGLLSRSAWVVTGQSRGVDTGETVRYPDVVVEPIGGARKGLSTTRVSLLIEVLSPSTAELDLTVKPAEYMQLAELQAYIVASQDRPEVRIWLRDNDGRFPDTPALVEGLDKMIEISAMSLKIPMAEIYVGFSS